MREKWIGEEDNTSGTYIDTICEELQSRHGGRINAMKLYRFNSRLGQEYNITDREVVNNIDKLITEEKLTELTEYLYKVIIEKFGIVEFLHNIGLKIAEERSNGYKKGKEHMQKELRQLLGIR